MIRQALATVATAGVILVALWLLVVLAFALGGGPS